MFPKMKMEGMVMVSLPYQFGIERRAGQSLESLSSIRLFSLQKFDEKSLCDTLLQVLTMFGMLVFQGESYSY